MPIQDKKEQKTCPVCSRKFSNRKKWKSRGAWDSVIYCSKKCRAEAKKSLSQKSR